MRKINILLTILLVAPLGFAKSQDLISAQELGKLYKSKDVVVVSTRKASDYKKVHVFGAVHIDHTQLYKDGPVKNMLKSPEEIAKIFGAQGISNAKKVVLYDDGTGKYAGRLYWIMKYLGAEDVKILDGHMDAWRAARKPVTKNPTKVTAATFTPKVNKSIIATMAEVKAGGATILDARSAAEYKGTAETELRKGHIPGAINIEFSQTMDAKGKMKSADELKKLFAKVPKDKAVILYCESGVRAGIVYFALTSILDYTNVKVYDGAYLEWQANANNKVDA
jgi:thiosulfate/3-mercaptopyruvate sulfurtransferase